MDVFGGLFCLSAIKTEGADAPGGFLFFKAIDARRSQTDSRTTSNRNSNGVTGEGRGGGVAKESSDEIGFIFKTVAQVRPQFRSRGTFLPCNDGYNSVKMIWAVFKH